jgi:hypothetical protein
MKTTLAGTGTDGIPFVRDSPSAADPRLQVPDLLGGVSKQRVAFMQRAIQMQRLGGVSIVLLLSS